MKLRPYQLEAVAAVEDAVARGVTHPLVGLPTGTGKTILFGEVVKRRADLGPALILAHRDELLDQAAAKITQAMPDTWVGKIKAGRNEWHLPVVVASVQTLARQSRLDAIPPGYFKTVVVDEAHHATGDNTYGRVLNHIDAPLTLGVTATPKRSDGKALGEVWQEIVYHRGILEMIEQGYLVDIKGIQVKLRRFNTAALKVNRGDYQDGQASRALVEAGAPKHAAQAYLEQAAGRKAILFTPTVELAHLMAAEFRNQGVPSEALDGTTPAEERRGIIQRLASGETMVVANCGVLTEGFDEPSVSCIINARPTRSQTLYVQQIGRGTRLYPGKEDCLVLDMVGANENVDLVTIPTLFGVKKKDAELGIGAASKLVSQLIGQTAARPTADDDNGDLIGKVVDLFGGRKAMHWLRIDNARWTLSIGNGFLALERDLVGGGKWSVRVYEQGKQMRQLAGGLDLGYAQGMAEDYVREIGAVGLTDPDAAWRRQPASPAQREQMSKLKIAYESTITKGAATDLISAAYAAKKLLRAS